MPFPSSITLNRLIVGIALSLGALAIASAVPIVLAQSEPAAQPAEEARPDEESEATEPVEEKADQEKPAAAEVKPKSADAPAEIEPPRQPTAAEILEALTRPEDAPPKPVILPTQPGQTVRRTEMDPSALPRNAVAPITPRLYPDGYRIVDRPGRLTREGDFYVFSFESRGRGEPEMPIRLLPNRLLEDMEIVSAGGTKPLVFQISGELTEYHGVNYLLVQKLLTRPELGNLK